MPPRLDVELRREAEHLLADPQMDGARTGMIRHQLLQLAHHRVGEPVDRQCHLDWTGRGGRGEVVTRDLHCDQLRLLLSSVETAADDDDGILLEETPVLGHRLREDHDLDGGIEVLQGEGGHPVPRFVYRAESPVTTPPVVTAPRAAAPPSAAKPAEELESSTSLTLLSATRRNAASRPRRG